MRQFQYPIISMAHPCIRYKVCRVAINDASTVLGMCKCVLVGTLLQCADAVLPMQEACDHHISVKEVKNVIIGLFSFLRQQRSFLFFFKCCQQWGFLQFANQCEKLPVVEMHSAKGPVGHQFTNHLISTCNAVFNQYSLFFQYVLLRVLEFGKKKIIQCIVACTRRGFFPLACAGDLTKQAICCGGDSRSCEGRELFTQLDAPFLPTTGSAVGSAGGVGPLRCSFRNGQKDPNVPIGVTQSPRCSSCPCLVPWECLENIGETAEKKNNRKL